MERGKLGLILLSAILLVNFSSALSCNFPAADINVSSGNTPSAISVNCSNGLNSSVSLWNQGSFFSTTPSFSSTSPLTIAANSFQAFTIIFNQMNNVGSFTGTFWSSDGMFQTIKVNVEESNPTGCQLNPSLASYTQSVQKGSSLPLPKVTFSPTNCDGTLLLDNSHVYIEGGIITSGINKPVLISSIVSDGVNLEINTEGLNSQTYSSKLKISAFSKIFEIPFVIIVTGGTSPQGNFSADNLPTCSLNAINLNLNNTYSLICSNLQTDISITPVIDNNYIKGVGSDNSDTQYIWNFKAKKIGVTNITACFDYLGSPMGDCFYNEVKITNSGTSIVGGITLDLIFYQNGQSKNKDSLGAVDTIIHIVDNSTRNILDDAKFYLGGFETTNHTINMKSGEVYELAATYPGYLPLYTNISASEVPIIFTISPSKTSYSVGEVVTITSELANVSYLLNNVIITSPYTFSSVGNFTLKAVKQGYADTEMQVNVTDSVFVKEGMKADDWKKGEDILLVLNKISSWSVEFTEQSKDDDGNIIYTSPVTTLVSGTGDKISFNSDKIGKYEIKADGVTIATKYVKSSFWRKVTWWQYGLSVVGVFFCVIFLFSRINSGVGSTKENEGFDMSGRGG